MACLLATRLGLNLRGLTHRYPEAFLVTLAPSETKANQGSDLDIAAKGVAAQSWTAAEWRASTVDKTRWPGEIEVN